MQITTAAFFLTASALITVAYAQIIASSGTNWLSPEVPNIQLGQPWTALQTNTTPSYKFSLKDPNTAPEMSSPASNLPKPGIYESEPYTCIVIVPGAIGDDCNANKSGSATQSDMPIKNPGVNLVPLSDGATLVPLSEAEK
jgi:hypothetical protein